MAIAATQPAPSAARSDLAAAGLVLAIGLAVLVLRPPLALDETRYLHVLQSMPRGGWILLHENGAPYTHKPPLLFWLAWLLGGAFGLQQLALRALPALCSALCVLLAGRVGRRFGSAHAAWVQAALLLPLLFAQALYFDALLSACVWAALLAWIAGRTGWAGLALGAALLAKGPVALLSFVPLALALAHLRPRRPSARGSAGALALACTLGLALLAAWALAAGLLGGPLVRQELWFDQTAGRIAQFLARGSPGSAPPSFPHREPFWFYVPVALLGALPFTPALAYWPRAERAALRAAGARPLVVALAFVLLAFSLISGKQPHYVLPLAPALALVLALRLERPAGERWCSVALLALFGAGLASAPWWSRAPLERYGAYGAALLDSAAFTGGCAGAALALFGSAAWIALRRPPPRAWIAAHVLALGCAFALAHFAIGRVATPRALAAQLAAEPERALASYDEHKAGLYNHLAHRFEIPDLEGAEQLRAWCAEHPGGRVIADQHSRELLLANGLALLLEDRERGGTVLLFGVPGPAPATADKPR